MPTTETFPEWQHRLIETRTIRDTRIKVTAGLHYLSGNERPYFSVTCDLYEKAGNGRWVDVGGGAAHDEILRAFPHLAPVVALHLADDHGVPMHAIDNAIYHLGHGRYHSEHPDRWEHFKSHLRVDEIEARHIERLIADTPTDERKAALSAYIDEHLVTRWQNEADTAVALLIDPTEAAIALLIEPT